MSSGYERYINKVIIVITIIIIVIIIIIISFEISLVLRIWSP